MQEKIFIDTSFVIALIDVNNSYHQKAIEFAVKFKEYYFITTDATLFEITKHLSHQYKLKAIRFIEKAINLKTVYIVQSTPELFEKSFTMYKDNKDTKWSLGHCFSFVVMRDKGISKVLTFDEYFTEAGFYVLPDIYK